MDPLSMQGPYDMNFKTIDQIVTHQSPGNYILGYSNSQNTFIEQYVGRSDLDVGIELKARLSSLKYKKFKFSYADSPKAAFEKDCRYYHEFGGSGYLQNERHPERPDGMCWNCPVCKIYDSPLLAALSEGQRS
jgi:hypothetical protein